MPRSPIIFSLVTGRFQALGFAYCSADALRRLMWVCGSPGRKRPTSSGRGLPSYGRRAHRTSDICLLGCLRHGALELRALFPCNPRDIGCDQRLHCRMPATHSPWRLAHALTGATRSMEPDSRQLGPTTFVLAPAPYGGTCRGPSCAAKPSAHRMFSFVRAHTLSHMSPHTHFPSFVLECATFMCVCV